ncbi:MAG: FAD-binding oxidoreductase [Thermocrispum sp.]
MSVTTGDLRQVFQGPVHAPDDPGYHDLRTSLKLRVNPEPALVAEASDVADVQAALRWARERGIPFALQATGHGTFVPSDGGLLVRIGRMGGVLVDPDLRIAEVQAGTRWGDVVSAAAQYGLAPLSGTAHDVGVVGYTIGGGIGWIARPFGYAADSMLSAEVVTTDGELVKANDDEHADLFWALRGGGASLGIVTSLRFRLYPLEKVYGGNMLFPIERAAEAFAFYAGWAEPAELTTAVVVQRNSPLESVPGRCWPSADCTRAPRTAASARSSRCWTSQARHCTTGSRRPRSRTRRSARRARRTSSCSTSCRNR